MNLHDVTLEISKVYSLHRDVEVWPYTGLQMASPSTTPKASRASVEGAAARDLRTTHIVS